MALKVSTDAELYVSVMTEGVRPKTPFLLDFETRYTFDKGYISVALTDGRVVSIHQDCLPQILNISTNHSNFLTQRSAIELIAKNPKNYYKGLIALCNGQRFYLQSEEVSCLVDAKELISVLTDAVLSGVVYLPYECFEVPIILTPTLKDDKYFVYGGWFILKSNTNTLYFVTSDFIAGLANIGNVHYNLLQGKEWSKSNNNYEHIMVFKNESSVNTTNTYIMFRSHEWGVLGSIPIEETIGTIVPGTRGKIFVKHFDLNDLFVNATNATNDKFKTEQDLLFKYNQMSSKVLYPNVNQWLRAFVFNLIDSLTYNSDYSESQICKAVYHSVTLNKYQPVISSAILTNDSTQDSVYGFEGTREFVKFMTDTSSLTEDYIVGELQKLIPVDYMKANPMTLNDPLVKFQSISIIDYMETLDLTLFFNSLYHFRGLFDKAEERIPDGSGNLIILNRVSPISGIRNYKDESTFLNTAKSIVMKSEPVTSLIKYRPVKDDIKSILEALDPSYTLTEQEKQFGDSPMAVKPLWRYFKE